MRKLLAILPVLFLTVACQKKPDPPAPAANAPTPTIPDTPPPSPPPPPVTNCQGATVLYSLPGYETVNDNSSRDFTVPHFELSCGDSVTVFFRAAIFPGPAWIELHDVDNGASYYSILNQVVTIHNRTGIVMQVDIEAVLK